MTLSPPTAREIAREIVFDTETTGFGVEEHRMVEIGAVELINHLPTGKTFQAYLNPQREIDWSATKVHGITNEKVATCPTFADIAPQWLAFVGTATLIAHNAEFDLSFLGMELLRAGHPRPTNAVVDTLALARQKIPGQGRYNLDALCRYYGIDLSARTHHGALLDAQLLAEVYIELMGGLQNSLDLQPNHPPIHSSPQTHSLPCVALAQQGQSLSYFPPTPQEISTHQSFHTTHIKDPKWQSNS
jgi:DNA polymerase-3 subunit epsilon